ncbi:hypothetical protein D9M71_367920 [compost metagenome]
MCLLLLVSQIIEIAVEAVVQSNDDIHVALGVDIRIVAIGALEKNFEVLIGVRRGRGFQHVLDRIVGPAGLFDGALV